MSASYTGGEVHYTKRYHLGEQSLRRRRERLEARLREAELLRRGDVLDLPAMPVLSDEDLVLK